MLDGCRGLLNWAFLILLWVAPALLSAATPAEFKRAKNLFEYGDYAGAIPVLEELIVPGRLEDENELAAAHRQQRAFTGREGKGKNMAAVKTRNE